VQCARGQNCNEQNRKAVAGGQNCKLGSATLTDIDAASAVAAGCCWVQCARGQNCNEQNRKASAGGQNCKLGAATLTDIDAASVVVAGCC
jgi:hypothetical protein